MRVRQHADCQSRHRASIKVESMVSGTFKLSGWGYEGQSVDDLERYLTTSQVVALVDIRLNPISRKKGFSKKALAATVEALGASYVHLPELGNPKENRAGFQDPGSSAHSRAIEHFQNAVLSAPAAEAAIDRVLELLTDGPVVLLCYEMSESRCHRAPVIEAITSRKLSKLEI